jgi:hypothetical protein
MASVVVSSTTTGPAPTNGPPAVRGGSVRPSGLRMVLSTRSWLYVSRWRAASTTAGAQR